jgi:hypothetical protein
MTSNAPDFPLNLASSSQEGSIQCDTRVEQIAFLNYYPKDKSLISHERQEPAVT